MSTPSIEPDQGRWSRFYAVSGSARGSNGPASMTVALPEQMESTLLQGPLGPGYHLFGRNDSDQGMGLKLALTDDAGTAIHRVNLIGPAHGGGSATTTFPLRDSIRWLSLAVGASEISMIDSGSYTVRIQRSASTTWRMEFEHVSGTEKYPWFHGGWATLTTSAPQPPWQSMEYSFELSNAEGTLTGDIRLTETEDRSS